MKWAVRMLRRDWTHDDLLALPENDGHRYAYWRVELDGPGAPLVVVSSLDGDAYREVVTVRAGDVVVVDYPCQVEPRPSDLIGPWRRAGRGTNGWLETERPEAAH